MPEKLGFAFFVLAGLTPRYAERKGLKYWSQGWFPAQVKEVFNEKAEYGG